MKSGQTSKARTTVVVALAVIVAAAGVVAYFVFIPAAALEATAVLRNADGATIGEARFVQESGGVRVSFQVRGLPAGEHGTHIHAVSKCEPTGFTSAGAHFNPFGKKHGLQNTEGPHAGDSPNLVVDSAGTGRLEYLNNFVTLKSGESNTLFDTDGSALVIHANPDDNKTDPTGNSGGRIVCGVIERKS